VSRLLAIVRQGASTLVYAKKTPTGSIKTPIRGRPVRRGSQESRGVPPPAREELRALAELVQEIRLRHGLSQEAVGLDGGLRRKYIGQLERGELTPSFRGLVGVAHGLGMSPAAFLRALAERLDA
jgi:DNA-binding XRE family transcriptional regulator